MDESWLQCRIFQPVRPRAGRLWLIESSCRSATCCRSRWGPLLVVGSRRSLAFSLRVVAAHEPKRIQAFAPKLAVERLDEGVLPPRSRTCGGPRQWRCQPPPASARRRAAPLRTRVFIVHSASGPCTKTGVLRLCAAQNTAVGHLFCLESFGFIRIISETAIEVLHCTD
jgi:hypothetical protein